MKKKNIIFIAGGASFIFTALLELILCFYGPIVLDVKSTCFVFPLYTTIEEEEGRELAEAFTKALEKSRKYIVVKQEHAEKTLEENNMLLSKIIKSPSPAKYAEAVKIIGAEKFTMGYIMKNADGYEILINMHLTKLAESVKKEKLNAGTKEELLLSMNDYIKRIDGEKTNLSLFEILYFYGLLLYGLFGLFLIFLGMPFVKFTQGTGQEKIAAFFQLHFPEILIIYTLFLYVFAFLYASNANMDYVQRFMATGGNLRLAASTSLERINAGIRYFPLLLIAASAFIYTRIKRKELQLDTHISSNWRALWALPLILLSAVMTTLAHPNIISLHGFTFLGFISLVPLLLVIDANKTAPSILYGVSFGVLFTLFTNFWLGTFSLVSLQVVMIIFTGFYLIFMIPAVIIYKKVKVLKFLIFPFAWVLFSQISATGFLGYPWCMIGTSQYDFLPLIQISALTGVWGIIFIVVLINSVLSIIVKYSLKKEWTKIALPAIVGGAVFLLSVIGGVIYLGITSGEEKKSVRIALVQDSMDPRKHKTRDVMETLTKLSREALKEKPDIIAWPEGSFNTDYEAFPNKKLIKNLRNFQKETGTWLITGTMQYKDEAAVEAVRRGEGTDFDSFNSSMLLDKEGNVTQVYHKIHLVPFTEHFPYEKEFPWLYKMLKDFDINWWEKGDTRVRFEHPKFTFFTPICFEDVFGSEVRLFVKEDADVILNLSNDYWSQSPVEGKQHTVNSLFRAVENRRPFVRTTTSGLTCYIDSAGRIRQELPYYESGYIIADVEFPVRGKTFYTIYGDWFVCFSWICMAVLVMLSVIPWTRKRLPE